MLKQKDIKLSKKKSLFDKENDKHNRIQFCKDHIQLKKEHPEYYDAIDVNFDNLLLRYQSANPLDHFYNTAFSMSYAEKMRITEIELFREKFIMLKATNLTNEQIEDNFLIK